jgi:hypothetical protein
MPNLKYIYVSKKRGNPQLIEALLSTLYNCLYTLYDLRVILISVVVSTSNTSRLARLSLAPAAYNPNRIL